MVLGTMNQTYCDSWPNLFVLPWWQKKESDLLEGGRVWEETYFVEASQPTVLSADSESISEEEMFGILHEFVSKFLARARPLDPEYAKLLNEHFWELLM